MQPDDDLKTTLSKWPFILGDVLLVAAALAIANLGDWQLTNWQVAFCVISVALGAGLFVLPYVVEFKVRVREETEDRKSDLRILQRDTVATQDQLEAVSDRIENLETLLNNLPRANDEPAESVDLSEPIEALKGQIDTLGSAQTEQASQFEALAKELVSLAKRIKAKPALDALDAKTKKTRAPRKRRKLEPRLLKRAIGQKQDNSSAAVSRIIRSEPKATGAEAEVREPEPEPEPEPKAAQKPEEAQSPEKSKESKPKSEETPKATPVETVPNLVVDPIFEEYQGEPIETVVPEAMSQAVPAQAIKRTRVKKSDTAVIASVFIGIGNKPFVRGSGAGLNWETGLAMEFEEIGKWRWIVPVELKESVEVQVFRNDADPDTTGKYTLKPGQQLQLTPVF